MTKPITTQIYQYLWSVKHLPSGRNFRILLWYFLGFVCLVLFHGVVFQLIMRYEGQQHSFLSGVYWTITTMATVGFGDIVFKSDLGHAFSIFVVLSGSVFILTLIPVAFIQFFYAPWMEAQAAARAPRRLPEHVRDHVIFTRYGPVTTALLARLARNRQPYVFIVPNLDDALHLHDIGVHVMLGDLDSPETYRAGGVDRARMVVTTHDDTVNANIAFAVRAVNDDVPIVATAERTASEEVMRIAGCSHVLRLGDLMGDALARRTIGGDAMTHVIGSIDELMIAEASAVRTPLVGKTLRENRLTDLGVTVVGVWDRGKFDPAGPDTLITPSTVLVLAGSREQLDNYDEHFSIYNVSAEPVLIIGGGRVGRATARALRQRAVDYRVVELVPGRSGEPDKEIAGDAADHDVLARAGFRKAPAVIVTTHDDNVNLYLTILLRHLRPDVLIISRSSLERTVQSLHRAGADFVISSASMVASIIVNLLKRASMLMLAEGLNVFRLPVPPSLRGRSLAETDVRQQTGCTVVAVYENGAMVPNPDPANPLPEDGELLLIGGAGAEERFRSHYGDD